MRIVVDALDKTTARSDSRPLGGTIKRLFDLALAVGGLSLLAPTMLLVALLIKISDGGPILYRERRVGYSGRSFECLKFRTMVVDAERTLAIHFKQNPEACEEWIASRKVRNDPRVTALGRVLRKLSVDELPQLLNILRGEMSIVGPRPIVEREIANYGDNAIYYYCARPGLTGPWQVSGRSNLPYDMRVELDTEYARNWSLATDCLIVLRTIPAVVSTRGAY